MNEPGKKEETQETEKESETPPTLGVNVTEKIEITEKLG
jgi:hypothetical protein